MSRKIRQQRFKPLPPANGYMDRAAPLTKRRIPHRTRAPKAVPLLGHPLRAMLLCFMPLMLKCYNIKSQEVMVWLVQRCQARDVYRLSVTLTLRHLIHGSKFITSDMNSRMTISLRLVLLRCVAANVHAVSILACMH